MMTFQIDDALLPATLSAPPMTDRQFAELCGEHPGLFLQTTAEGDLIVMQPAYTLRGVRNAGITSQLSEWSEADGRGCAAGAGTGFVLSNGARRAPDASWTLLDEIGKLPQDIFEAYWHLCQAFVIELRCLSDRLPMLRSKMHEYTENRAQLGWLIDPQTKTVEIFRPGRDSEVLPNTAESVTGEGPVHGFTLDLLKVWKPVRRRSR